MQKSTEEIAQALSAPFESSEVKFKPQSISGNRALAVPFVDARVVMDRLDDVLGVFNWKDSYTVLPDGAVICRLEIRIDGEWIGKEDVGGESEQPDEGDRRKAAFSDSLKRAAVKVGVARYLYRQKPQWVDYDPQRKQFTRQPTLPQSARPAPAEKKPLNRAHQEAIKFGLECEKAGLCKARDVGEHLVQKLGGKYGPAIAAWPDGALEDVAAACVAFKAARTRASDDLLDELGAELDRVGETWPRAMAKLKLAADTNAKSLTEAQVRQLLEALKPMPDGVMA